MIPLARRSTRRLETTLVSSYSRQNLPRPARLYSSPSKRANAPALATASGPATDYPPFMPPPTASASENSVAVSEDMQSFLRKRAPYTILPTPLPSDQTSPINEYYFTDSPTQDQVSIIDACLHNLYDVPRAKQIFERLRKGDKGGPLLEQRVYNSFLDAYVEMATTKQFERRTHWIEDTCALYETMEMGKEKVVPGAATYAIMLRAWIRFNPDSASPVSQTVEVPDPTNLLRSIVDRQIPVSLVVSDRSFQNSEEAAEAIKLLSKAAVTMNLSKIVSELGVAQCLGSQLPDPLEAVPEVMPVLKAKVKKPDIQITHAEDGTITHIDIKEAPDEVEYEIPFNLENLRKHLAQVVLARRVLPEDAAARQKLLEESVYDVAVERLKHQAELFEELGLGSKGLGNVDLRTWMWNWHQKLQARLKAEINNLVIEERRLPESKLPTRLSPFLSLISAEKLSMITVFELMHLHGSGGVIDGMKTARAILGVGKAVEVEYKAEMCKKNNITMPSNPARANDHGYFSRLGYRDLHARRVAARKYMEDSEEWTSDWTQLVRVRVGSFLVDCLMDVATVTRTAVDPRTQEPLSEEQPAFYHSYEYMRGHKLGVIKLNTLVSERIAKDSLRETLHPRHLPMLVKPKPWLSHDEGGYLYNKTSVMRFKESQEQQSYLRHASELGNVELVFAGLDVLSTTPWKINREIFDVVLKVWNSGERLGKIPPAVFDQPEPQKPENADYDPKAKTVYQDRMKEYSQSKASNHSDRCSVNYKIEIARTFLGDTIYLPHNVDFRGRAYPIPPHLNHIGNDLSRGLLKFGEAKPLGESGLRWLKIHLSNLYGYDKASFDERVEFVHEHLEDIYDSAEKPLDGMRWWTRADDPWQCLATCMELRAALESPDPLAFESSLPVHQDGTCNGLQHYAALGGDDRGAKQVNLDVTDRPSDVYTYVANMVEEQLKKEVEKGEHYAKLLSGKVSRKVVKQTVMTTVYGVTFIGAREQIEKQLKDRGDIPFEECWLAAAYLAKNVLNCIGDLFKGAKDIQNWLNFSARLISKSIPPDRIIASQTYTSGKRGVVAKSRLTKEQMTSVIWTTPLGLPIVQPYRQTKRRQIMTALQTVYISDPSVPAAVNTMKQASAFPPNFIHSLDATHMMLTALECRTRNITFASVHDSYWTHACSVDTMSEVIRETFIALHSSDVLQKLYDEFQERYQGYKIPLTSIERVKFGTKLIKMGSSKDVAVSVAELEADEAEDIQALAPSLDEDEDFGDEAEKPRRKAGRRKKGELPTEAETDTKFVNLVDMLPAVPKKGAFDVNTIKKSLYFFS